MARFPPRRSYRVGSAMTSSSRRPSLTDTMMNHRTCLTITSTDLSVRKKPHVDPSVPVSPGPRPPVNRARFDADVAGIASLSEPTRRALYLYVQAQASPVSRDEAAAGVGVPRHTAKFHLDKLGADGLLESEDRRAAGCRGQGPSSISTSWSRTACWNPSTGGARGARAEGRGVPPSSTAAGPESSRSCCRTGATNWPDSSWHTQSPKREATACP